MVSINFEGAKQFYAKQPDKTAAQAAFDTLVNGTGAGNDFIHHHFCETVMLKFRSLPQALHRRGPPAGKLRQGRVRPHSGCGKKDPV